MVTIISSFFWISVCIYNEAQGEIPAGQVAVGQVIMNRAIQRKMSVRAVIQEDEQFSWYNGGKMPPIEYYKEFIESMESAATMFLQRLSGDTLKGANLYYNPDKADPYWAHLDRVKTIERIDHHIFMKE